MQFFRTRLGNAKYPVFTIVYRVTICFIKCDCDFMSANMSASTTIFH